MKKQQSQKYKQKHHRKHFGWLLCMVALLFAKVACEPLTEDEKKSLKGSYFEFNKNFGIGYSNLSFSCADNFKLNSDQYFSLEKFTDNDTLQKFGGGKFYFKSILRSKILVMYADESLRYYNDARELMTVYYKISCAKDFRLEANAFNQEEKVAIKDNFNQTNFEELAKILDKHILKPEKGPEVKLEPFDQETMNSNINIDHQTQFATNFNVNTDHQYKEKNADNDTTTRKQQNFQRQYTDKNDNNDTGKQNNGILQFFIFGCLIVLLIVLIFVCFRSVGENDNVPEELQFNQVEKSELSNHYPSPTDLVIDVKYIETVESTKLNTNQSVSITNATIEHVLPSKSTYTEEAESNTVQSSSIFTSNDTAEVKTISAKLFLSVLNDSQSEVREPKETDETELTVKKTDDSSSIPDDENENTTDMSIDDNDDCGI